MVESPPDNPAPHPRCSECALPMWLTKIVKHASGDPKLAERHYECKVCDAVTVLLGPEASGLARR